VQTALVKTPVQVEPNEARRLEEIEHEAMVAALKQHDFNRTEAAKALGISRRTLVYKLQRLRDLGFDVDGQ
jgi:DNA-binding NtrC family response regulator